MFTVQLIKEQQPRLFSWLCCCKRWLHKDRFMGGMALPAVINYGYGFLQGANCLAAKRNEGKR